MTDPLNWIEAHPGLAGYAQTLGSFIALGIAIGLPRLQRRSMEEAAELMFGSVLIECHAAVSMVECLAEDEPEFDVPGPALQPTEIARRLSRASARLDRVSLFEFSPKCRVLIQRLQSEMSAAAFRVEAYVEDNSTSLDQCDYDQGERVYRLMLELLEGMRAFKNEELSWTLHSQIAHIDERNADKPIIKRVRAEPTGAAVAKTWRSLWLRRSLRQAT